LVEKFLAMANRGEQQGCGKMRVMTNLSAERYWTLVGEMEVLSLEAFMAMGRDEEDAEAFDRTAGPCRKHPARAAGSAYQPARSPPERDGPGLCPVPWVLSASSNEGSSDAAVPPAAKVLPLVHPPIRGVSMGAIRLISILSGIVLMAACSEPVSVPEQMEPPVLMSFQAQGTLNFGAILSGSEEVPPVSTEARGTAQFQVKRAGADMEFRLIVANIENVTQAHIHCGPQGANGPVVLWLYPPAPPAVLIPGRSDGILSHGTATAAEVIARPDSPACPGGVASMADLLAKMHTGGTYVNVHTSAYPAGEIRGQIQVRGAFQVR
jgi:hypothetical protein